MNRLNGSQKQRSRALRNEEKKEMTQKDETAASGVDKAVEGLSLKDSEPKKTASKPKVPKVDANAALLVSPVEE